MRYGVGPIPLRAGFWNKWGAKVKGAQPIERNEKRNKTLGLLCFKVFSRGRGYEELPFLHMPIGPFSSI